MSMNTLSEEQQYRYNMLCKVKDAFNNIDFRYVSTKDLEQMYDQFNKYPER